MTDIFAPLRKFHRADIKVPPGINFPDDCALGQIGLMRFYVVRNCDGSLMIFLERQRGRPTEQNIAAFWRNWGIPPPEEYQVETALTLPKRAVFTIHQDEVEKMITPQTETSGPPSVLCTCDICGRESHERAKLERSRGHRTPDVASDGQVMRRLQGKGWTYLQKTLRCPSCEDQRKAKAKLTPTPEELPVPTTATVSPEPSREQKRLIMALLEGVYVVDAGRYSGNETDTTVAQALGPDFKTDWVSQIREEFFGPDGNDTALLEISAEIAELRNEIKGVSDQITAAEVALKDHYRTVDSLHLRLDKAVAAIEKIAGGKK